MFLVDNCASAFSEFFLQLFMKYFEKYEISQLVLDTNMELSVKVLWFLDRMNFIEATGVYPGYISVMTFFDIFASRDRIGFKK